MKCTTLDFVGDTTFPLSQQWHQQDRYHCQDNTDQTFVWGFTKNERLAGVPCHETGQ